MRCPHRGECRGAASWNSSYWGGSHFGCGLISGHLVADPLRQGYDQVRAVDIKPPNQRFQKFPQADNRSLDLWEKDNCYRALENADHVYNLAADVGGMGFIENNKALCMLSVTINTHPERLRDRPGQRRGPVLLFVVRLRLQPGDAGHARRGAALRGRCLPGPDRCRDGRSSSASGWALGAQRPSSLRAAATSGRTLASRPAWPATTTSTARSAPTTAGGRRPRRR